MNTKATGCSRDEEQGSIAIKYIDDWREVLDMLNPFEERVSNRPYFSELVQKFDQSQNQFNAACDEATNTCWYEYVNLLMDEARRSRNPGLCDVQDMSFMWRHIV